MNTPLKSEVLLEVSSGGAPHLAGLPLFVDHDAELMRQIELLLATKSTSLIVTANVDQALDLSRNENLWEAYNYAKIRTLDGMPLVWMARLLGARKVYRQTGADLLTKCAAESQHRGWKIVVLGGARAVNASAVECLLKDYPLADVVGVDVPYFSGFESPEISVVTQTLLALKPDVVFICLGSPKQENFLMGLKDRLPPAVYVGAGAAVDFAGGARRRAPKIAQLMGLEWTWRLAQEPRRLGRRYLLKGAGLGRILYNSIRRNKK